MEFDVSTDTFVGYYLMYDGAGGDTLVPLTVDMWCLLVVTLEK